MKVAYLNTVCGGSTGRLAAGLGRAVVADGGESLLLYGRGGPADGLACLRVDKKAEVYFHAAAARLSDREGHYSRAATRRLLAALDAFAPDVIHLHNLHGYWLDRPMLFAYLAARAVPVIWTLHDCHALTGHCAYFDRPRCSRWETGCHDCPEKKIYPASILCDRSADNYADKKRMSEALKNLTLVTPSPWLGDVAARSLLNTHPVEVICNGVDTAVFKPTASDLRARYGLVGKKLLVAAAAPWGPAKGLPDLIELAETLPAEYTVAALGLSEKQRRGLPARMLGLPRTENAAELAGWYTAADLTVLTSRSESFSMVAAESLCCGTPVVGFTAGGPESMAPADCSRFVPWGDDAALRDAVCDWASRETDRAAIAAAAQTRFALPVMTAAYQALYDRATTSKGEKT